MLPTSVLPGRGPEKRSGNAAFDALLDTLRIGEDKPRIKNGQAAAELLRIDMMRNSLSLADDEEAPRSSGSPSLATLLAGLAENGRTTQEAKATTASPVEVSSNASPTGTDIGEIGRTAFHYLGTPYLFGGEGPSGIDCSSFVQQVFREHRINLPRTAREQSMTGSEVADGDLRKGDLVFFHTYASYPSHVGIYLGDGKMIHASSAKGEVVISDINTDYYKSRFLGAKRVA
jgi:cell wall-associated NlpC family hydrolase